ncbi:histone-lysine N-methyltransferase ATXR4 isoform X1 [Cucumis melo var. makuwa]|uniref:Histone-lysine N-methyltransferase ATXR4 isoform X1 n=1 Tax=Cucumis melo var. makuwa TaxID=1194695 RepID=A0A5D3DPG6_CUCMM|nr:histone-lysine N-methyltransferase ATXR4 isoform X1 [Cucumis melo var. makuwa]
MEYTVEREMAPCSLLRFGRWISRFKFPYSQANPFSSLSPFSSSAGLRDADSAAPGGPPPIRVSLTDSVGRGVFATRKIGAGELIHTAKPLVAHPSPSSIHYVCYFCLRKLERNANVDSDARASFCSEECEQHSKVFHDVEMEADWSDYDNYCRERGLKYPLLVKRLACMVISGAVSSDLLDILQPSRLSTDMVLELEEGYNLLRKALINKNITNGRMLFLTQEWYTGVLARIRINAFRIELAGGYEDLHSLAAACVEAEAAVGNAVYMLPSFYNHDCDPNTHIIWINNANARLKALRDVDPGKFLVFRHKFKEMKSFGFATLMQVWTMTLVELCCTEGLVLFATVHGVRLVIKASLIVGINPYGCRCGHKSTLLVILLWLGFSWWPMGKKDQSLQYLKFANIFGM